MAKTGVNQFYYAKLTKDDKTGVTYETPVAIPGLRVINITPQSNSATLYADNGPWATDSALGTVNVSLELADLSLENQAALLGHTLKDGIMECTLDDKAPYVCIMFKSLKDNGSCQFVKLLKMRFSEAPDENQTKEENVAFRSPTITGQAVARTFDKKWYRKTDEDADGYTTAVGTAWFTSVEAA